MKDKLINRIEDNLIDFIMEADETYLDELLSKGGFDVGDINQRASQTQKQISFLSKAVVLNKKNNSLLEKATTLFKDAISKNIDKPITMLKSMINERGLGLQFRNLDKLTESEIKEIIKDKNLLDIIESLDEDESSV